MNHEEIASLIGEGREGDVDHGVLCDAFLELRDRARVEKVRARKRKMARASITKEVRDMRSLLEQWLDAAEDGEMDRLVALYDETRALLASTERPGTQVG